MDPLSQILILIALAALTFAAIEGHEYGWSSASFIGMFVLPALSVASLLIAVSGMPQAQAGLAAAIASTSRRIGAAIGVALIGVSAHARLQLANRSRPLPISYGRAWL